MVVKRLHKQQEHTSATLQEKGTFAANKHFHLVENLLHALSSTMSSRPLSFVIPAILLCWQEVMTSIEAGYCQVQKNNGFLSLNVTKSNCERHFTFFGEHRALSKNCSLPSRKVGSIWLEGKLEQFVYF